MTTTIIINPHARKGKAAALKPLVEAYVLEKRLDAVVRNCATPESLEAVFAALSSHSRVICVGGDGTIHRLLPYLIAGEHELGIVPYGSGDDAARAQGLYGMQWKAALEHALNAPAKPTDVGLVTSLSGDRRYFFACFLMGVDGLINNKTSGWKTTGPIPYFLTMLMQLPCLRGWRMDMLYTNKHGETLVPRANQILCTVMNTATYGSGYPIAPMSRMDDGTLTLLHAPMVGRLKFLVLFFKMLAGKHVDDKDCHFVEIEKLQVQCNQNLTLSADGEVIEWQTKAITVSVRPQALAVVGK